MTKQIQKSWVVDKNDGILEYWEKGIDADGHYLYVRFERKG